MSNTWVISDTHFGHAKIMTFKGNDQQFIRPGFQDIEEHDEHIIEKWNSVVGNDDTVWHLGDLTFKKATMDAIMPRLNGKRKHLLLGNHDNLEPRHYEKHFYTVGSWATSRDVGVDFPFVMCHYPLHKQAFNYRKGNPQWCIHGHLHEKLVKEAGYINVCCEHVNYTPVNIDELVKRMK